MGTRRELTQAMWRVGVYLVVWAGIIWLSVSLYRSGGQIHPELRWVGLLHPVIFGLTGWSFLRAVVEGRRWFRIRFGVLLLIYIWMGLGSAYFVFHFENLAYAALRVPHVALETLAVVILGTVAFRIFERVGHGRLLVDLLPELPRTPPWSMAMRIGLWSLLGLTILITVYLIESGAYIYQSGPGTGGLLSFLQFFQRAGLVGLSAGYFYWFRQSPQFNWLDRALLLTATGILAGFGLLSGMKMEVLLILLHVGLPYLILRYSREDSVAVPRTLVVATAMGLVVLFALTPLYRAGLRQLGSGSDGGDRFGRGLEAAGTMVSLVSSQSEVAGELVETGFVNIWSRTAMYMNLVPVVDQSPDEVPFTGFSDYLLLPATAVVPRIFWSTKPVNRLAGDFQRRYISGEEIFANMPSTFGTGYMRSGLLGAIIVFSLLGLLSGAVEEYSLGRFTPHLAAVLLYTVGFRILVNVEADMYWRLNGIPKEVAVLGASYLVLTGFVHLSGRRGTRTPSSSA